MKPIYIFLFILFGSALEATAQPGRDKVEQYRIAFITKRLDLTVEEAKQFWPVYNKYQDELEALRRNNKTDLDNIDFSKMSADEADAKAKEMIAQKQAELDVQKKYYGEFKKVIPPQKVLMLMKAEKDFKAQLVKLLAERKQGKQ